MMMRLCSNQEGCATKAVGTKDEIDLYGVGWQKEKNIYGKIANKLEAMKNHSFAVVIENCKYDGYVTEKLGDAIFIWITIHILWGL